MAETFVINLLNFYSHVSLSDKASFCNEVHVRTDPHTERIVVEYIYEG